MTLITGNLRYNATAVFLYPLGIKMSPDACLQVVAPVRGLLHKVSQHASLRIMLEQNRGAFGRLMENSSSVTGCSNRHWERPWDIQCDTAEYNCQHYNTLMECLFLMLESGQMTVSFGNSQVRLVTLECTFSLLNHLCKGIMHRGPISSHLLCHIIQTVPGCQSWNPSAIGLMMIKCLGAMSKISWDPVLQVDIWAKTSFSIHQSFWLISIHIYLHMNVDKYI